MTFNPDSTIYLCNVPIDSTYKNQIYFAKKTEQQEYFRTKVVKTFSNYLTVRKTLPDGSLQSSIKVDANIDELRSLNCNYMYYQNANHGTRFFYAFIDKLIYINEGTTEIVFDCDVYQTWLFDVFLKPSYVVREHAKSDIVGENVVPEKFNFQDYDYTQAIIFDSLDAWGYLVVTSETTDDYTRKGILHSGIYQGLYFYYFESVERLNELLNNLIEQGKDCVETITLIPRFCRDQNNPSADGLLLGSSSPASHTFEWSTTINERGFDEYPVRNNKLYTNPFFNIVVTNHAGEEAIYNVEDFYNNNARNDNERTFSFTMKGDVSVNPSVTLYPHHYKGVADNYDCGISISGFPQCSINSDTFRLWLARNQFGLATDTVKNVGMIAGGIAVTAATGGVGAVAGLGAVASGVTGILSTMNTTYQASKEPNKTSTGSAKNNLLTAIKKNKFDIYYRSIKREYAEMVDDFFTMYGYQTNKLKIPNVSSRPFFNYVQTIDCNIVGGIPSDDMERLKQVYNNGVTLWKHTATVGDYSVNNAPV